VRTNAEHLAHTLNPAPLFERVGHCVPVGTDDKIYKTAYTRGLDVKKHMSAYSIIFDIKKSHLSALICVNSIHYYYYYHYYYSYYYYYYYYYFNPR